MTQTGTPISTNDYLTSSSSLSQVKAAYENNATYDIENDVDMAKKFIQACRFLLQRMAERSKNSSSEIEKNVEVIEQQMKDALDWLQTNDSSFASQGHRGYVTGPDFGSFRT